MARDDIPYTQFCLVGSGKDDRDSERPSREAATKLWFITYGVMGEEIVTNARKGDQLFVEAIAQTMMGSDSAYDHTFIVTGFKFGARKGSPGSPVGRTGNQIPIAPTPSAEEAAALSA